MAKQGKYVYDWPRPMVTVDAAVFDISAHPPRILLIKRGSEPFKGQWAIPGGFIEMDEDLADAAARELAEETGLTGIKLQQLQTFGKPGRDQRGRNITVVFWGTTDKTEIRPGDDAAEAKWFEINNLPENLAFDHKEVAKIATKALRHKEM
jgi:8-oxo-dGTP diphosphatase